LWTWCQEFDILHMMEQPQDNKKERKDKRKTYLPVEIPIFKWLKINDIAIGVIQCFNFSNSPSSGAAHRKSSSLDAGDPRNPKHLVPSVRERFRCIVPYPPNSDHELELRVGDVIYVHRKRDDGWYKGTQQRTGRTGLFPASFVEPC